jgi:hypothetical protein
MIRSDRRQFLARHGAGLAMLAIAYLLVTVLRSVRADFAPEIWNGLNYKIVPDVYFRTEILVALGVVVASGLSISIANHRRAFQTAMATSLGGLALAAAAVVARRSGWLEGFGFMTVVGLGLYLPYVAVHTTIFERLIAMTRERANLGYLMYLVDAFGYLGYVGVMLTRVGGFVAMALAWWMLARNARKYLDLATEGTEDTEIG